MVTESKFCFVFSFLSKKHRRFYNILIYKEIRIFTNTRIHAPSPLRGVVFDRWRDMVYDF